MGQEDQVLHELCRRVAAGVPGAQEEFVERVAPLMELLAKRSLAGSPARDRASRHAAASQRHEAAPCSAGADREVKITRLSDRLCRSLIEKVRGRHREPGAETCAYRAPWPTERGRSAR